MEIERTKPQVLASEIMTSPWTPCPGWTDAVRRMLTSFGEDPNRVDLQKTPQRLYGALYEMLKGYRSDPTKYLKIQFDSTHDEMVVVKELPFVSLCEHHMLPFSGTVAVGYIPHRSIVGLSKIPRAVQALAQRLQVQERLTGEIADVFFETVKPRGVGVWVEASHTCMSCRGVKSSGSMVTSSMRGVFKDHPATRAEFLSAVRD